MLYKSLGISKQAAHKLLGRLARKKESESQVLRYLHDIRKDHPTMGIRDLYYMINPPDMGRDAFEELCRRKALMSEKKKNHRRTTDSSGVTRFENLLEKVKLERVNQAWQSDICYFEVKGRFYFLTFILDAWSRRILGYSASRGLSTLETTLPALKMAIKTRKDISLEGLIFHSDGGGQYYAKEFLKLTRKTGVRNSMCEYAWENGKAERINGVIKNNYLVHRNIGSYNDLIKEVDRSVRLYNNEKPHIALKRMSPVNFERKTAYLHGQAKPTMTGSLNAKQQVLGASSPNKPGQAKPQNQVVLPQMILT